MQAYQQGDVVTQKGVSIPEGAKKLSHKAVAREIGEEVVVAMEEEMRKVIKNVIKEDYSYTFSADLREKFLLIISDALAAYADEEVKVALKQRKGCCFAGVGQPCPIHEA